MPLITVKVIIMTTSNETSQSNTREERVRAASRERREVQKQELRGVILGAASELFLERGYDGFSLRAVAERIGYSATTIYLYFADKDELLFAVVDEGFQTFTAALTAAAESVSDPVGRLEAIGRAYVGFGLSHPAHYQLMFMQRPDFLLGYRPGECEPRIKGFGVLQQTVQEGIDAGVFPPGDAEAYSDALWAGVHGVVALAISIPVFDRGRAWRAYETQGQLNLARQNRNLADKE
jgi:AcrR family transcriptional regulator